MSQNWRVGFDPASGTSFGWMLARPYRSRLLASVLGWEISAPTLPPVTSSAPGRSFLCGRSAPATS